jgi:TonB family protein
MVRIARQTVINRSWMIASAGFGLLAGSGLAAGQDEDSQAIDPGYMETTLPQDTRFVTAVSRLTTCRIKNEVDLHKLQPRYPKESEKRHEEGKVIMQFVIDSNLCVRKASIVQSSGYFRLDKASLYFAMTMKLAPAMLKNQTSFDDGQLTFPFPITWILQKAYVPGDLCSGSAVCVDEKPPAPLAEVRGTPPDMGDIWMPGYYVHYPKTGYQWNDGQWESPRPSYHWIAPHWDKFRSKWLFVPGGWEQN